MSLARLAQRTAKDRPDIELGFMTTASSRLPLARESLFNSALVWGADYLFSLDADHHFPADALLRLLGHGCDVVGINQPTRSNKPEPTARTDDGALIHTTPDKAKRGVLERVGWNGFAMVLVAAKVVGRLKRPLFAYDGEVGEDHFFCRRLRDAGIPLFVDHGLSAEVRHLHSVELSYLDTLKGEANVASAILPPAGPG